MTKQMYPAAIEAAEAAERQNKSSYPEPYASLVAGRSKHPLGEPFGLRNFGVNLTRLRPGSISALHHRHSSQDEFVYVLEGEPTLFTDNGSVKLHPGMCAGFAAGGTAHHLVNLSQADVLILEVGDRSEGDDVEYPVDDIRAIPIGPTSWRFVRKDGSDFG
jgi:uncharacterized cupin superfamily protein